MAEPKPSSVRGGPNPKDQQEELEARITEIQECFQHHRDQAEQHQRQADRLIESATRRQAQGLPERRKMPRS
jgi:hypothetical protein